MWEAPEASEACAGRIPQGGAPDILYSHLGKSSGLIHFQEVRIWRKQPAYFVGEGTGFAALQECTHYTQSIKSIFIVLTHTHP